MSYTVTAYINGAKSAFACREGENVLDVLRANGVEIYSPCGGNGTCGKCRVKISGNISPADEHEKEILGNEIENGIRLACRAKIHGDITVYADGVDGMSVETTYKNISYGKTPLADGNYGLAVDIGTTTVAVYMCDLKSGTVIGTRSFVNPQQAYGADVISRIDKIMREKTALESEKNAIISSVNGAIVSLAEELKISKNDVCACVIGGNTVMEHILCGINPSPIAVSPFTAPTLFDGAYSTADKVGIDIVKNGVCLISPCFASYVGGDIALGIAATGLDISNDNALFLDIGTNGEIVLSAGGKLYLCSAAAGPAFEGARIECGSAGVPGAICAVSYENGDIKLKTVKNAEPCGICGSGLIDAAAVMLDMGVIDETGAFSDEIPPCAEKYVHGGRFYLTERIYISAADIRQVQLAKAAICAGIMTLMHKCKIAERDIDRVILAGGFGSHINVHSACRIGLIPRSLDGKAVFAGNTAGTGAVMALCDDGILRRLSLLYGKSEYTELSAEKYFSDEYINQMIFE